MSDYGISAGSAAPSQTVAATGPCRNCGTARVGDYCHGCGQRFVDGRLDVVTLVRGMMEHLADQGLLHTLREMTLDPGGVIRRYFDGQRRRYLAPHTYLFFGTALSFLSLQLYQGAFVEMARNEIVPAATGGGGGLSPDQAAAYLETLLAVSQQTAAVGLMTCVPFALLLRLVFRRSGINLAEALVFTFFTFGQAMVLQSLLTPLALVATRDLSVSVWMSQLPYVLVLSHSAAAFFGAPLRSVLKINAVLVVSIVVFTLALAAGIDAYVLLFR